MTPEQKQIATAFDAFIRQQAMPKMAERFAERGLCDDGKYVIKKSLVLPHPRLCGYLQHYNVVLTIEVGESHLSLCPDLTLEPNFILTPGYIHPGPAVKYPWYTWPIRLFSRIWYYFFPHKIYLDQWTREEIEAMEKTVDVLNDREHQKINTIGACDGNA